MCCSCVRACVRMAGSCLSLRHAHLACARVCVHSHVSVHVCGLGRVVASAFDMLIACARARVYARACVRTAGGGVGLRHAHYQPLEHLGAAPPPSLGGTHRVGATRPRPHAGRRGLRGQTLGRPAPKEACRRRRRKGYISGSRRRWASGCARRSAAGAVRTYHPCRRLRRPGGAGPSLCHQCSRV